MRRVAELREHPRTKLGAARAGRMHRHLRTGPRAATTFCAGGVGAAFALGSAGDKTPWRHASTAGDVGTDLSVRDAHAVNRT